MALKGVTKVSWEPTEFPGGANNTIELGRQLSLIIHCPVRLVSWAKPQYECWCGVVFPKFVVEGCIKSGNVQPLIDRHNGKFTVQSSLIVGRVCEPDN